MSLSEFLFYLLCLPHKCIQKKHGSLWSSCASRYSRCAALFAQTNFILTQIWSWLWKNNFSKSFNTIGTWFTRRAHRKISFFPFCEEVFGYFQCPRVINALRTNTSTLCHTEVPIITRRAATKLRMHEKVQCLYMKSKPEALAARRRPGYAPLESDNSSTSWGLSSIFPSDVSSKWMNRHRRC